MPAAKVPPPLAPQALDAALASLPGWAMTRSEGDRCALTRSFKFPSFAKAIGFMQAAVPHIDAVNHHPDWQNSYRTVAVSLSTHAAGHAVTENDIALAQYLSDLYEAWR